MKENEENGENDIIKYDIKNKPDKVSVQDNYSQNSYDEQNTEFINQEIPVNINPKFDRTGRINLSLEQERIIQKLPSFSTGYNKEREDIINSQKYINQKDYKPLIIRNPPIFFWLLGLIFISFGISIIINMILYRYHKNFLVAFHGKTVWEFIILIIIFIFGISFFIYSQYESIEVDKMKGIIKLYKFDIISCSSKIFVIQINCLNSIFPVRVQTLRNSGMERTCLTEIGITFDNSNTIICLRHYLDIQL
jgi:hypothetical protein